MFINLVLFYFCILMIFEFYFILPSLESNSGSATVCLMVVWSALVLMQEAFQIMRHEA